MQIHFILEYNYILLILEHLLVYYYAKFHFRTLKVDIWHDTSFASLLPGSGRADGAWAFGDDYRRDGLSRWRDWRCFGTSEISRKKNTEVSTKMGTWIFLGRYKTSKEFWFYASGLAHDHSMGWLDVWIICCLKMCSKKVRSRLELLDSWMTVDLRATHQFYVMSLNTLHQNIWTHHRLGYVCEFQLLTPTFCLMLG